MVRKAKTPMYDGFNTIVNGFGSHQIGDRRWQEYLDVHKPLVMELGCGKAELSMELAARYPEKNFIGVDIKADRLWRPAKKAVQENITNIVFVQKDIRLLGELFSQHSVSDIWITFPDPFPRKGGAKHRMTGPRFLSLYKQLLVEGGSVHFKTDDAVLFEWSIEQFMAQKMLVDYCTNDLHSEDGFEDAKIMTTFEHKWHSMNKPTHFVSARFS